MIAGGDSVQGKMKVTRAAIFEVFHECPQEPTTTQVENVSVEVRIGASDQEIERAFQGKFSLRSFQQHMSGLGCTHSQFKMWAAGPDYHQLLPTRNK